jgi:hypothetical protein
MRPIVRWITIFTLVFGAAACSRSLNKTSMESSLKTQLEAKTGITGVTVTCPDGIKAEKGGTFTCTAAAQGQTVTVQVTQTDDQGNVTFKIVK